MNYDKALIYNLTPHDINIINDDGSLNCVIPRSGIVARVESRTTAVADIMGIPITTTEFGDVMGLPEPNDDCCYVVSLAVAQRVPQRQDVFVTNESVRDSKGNIIGYKSLAVISTNKHVYKS